MDIKETICKDIAVANTANHLDQQLHKDIIDIDNGLVSIENYKSQELQRQVDKFSTLKAQVKFMIDTLEAKEESNKVLDNVLRQAKEAFN